MTTFYDKHLLKKFNILKVYSCNLCIFFLIIVILICYLTNFPDSSSIDEEKSGIPDVAWAYFICAFTALFVSLCFLYIYIGNKADEPLLENKKDKPEVSKDDKKKDKKFRFFLF